jgi:hypothetical protein
MGPLIGTKPHTGRRTVEASYKNISFTTACKATDKDFRIGDIIEFTSKVKGRPNLYLVREIVVLFEFGARELSTIEKQDASLPDINIVIKTHPLVQKS